MHLELGQRYIFLFYVYMLLFLVGMATYVITNAKVVVGFLLLAVPTMIAFVLVSQIRSGIALNSYWVAKYPRGTSAYRLLLALNIVAFIGAIMISKNAWDTVLSTGN